MENPLGLPDDMVDTHGLKAIESLKSINYSGDICLPAEYGRINMKGPIDG